MARTQESGGDGRPRGEQVVIRGRMQMTQNHASGKPHFSKSLTPPFAPDVCTSIFESDICGRVAVHVYASENEKTFFEHF